MKDTAIGAFYFAQIKKNATFCEKLKKNFWKLEKLSYLCIGLRK